MSAVTILCSKCQRPVQRVTAYVNAESRGQHLKVECHGAVEMMCLVPSALGHGMVASVFHTPPAELASGHACNFCGGVTRRTGTCWTCQECFETTGCG
jgi:hypothetical protein